MSKPFRIKRSVDNQFYFTIVGYNNRALAMAETLKQKQSAVKSLHAIYKIIADAIAEGKTCDDLIQDETLKK